MNRQRHHLALVRDLGRQVEDKAARPEPTVATFVDALVADRTSPGLGKKPWTAGTAYQNRTTYRLWAELMGDVPVTKVTGREAGLFRERLLQLPASHGKAVGKGGKRPQVTAKQAIEAADARDGVTRAVAEAAGKPPTGLVPRLSLKTAARHLCAMTGMWKWLRAREKVSNLPFTGFEFPRARSMRAARNDWSEADLLPWRRSARSGVAGCGCSQLRSPGPPTNPGPSGSAGRPRPQPGCGWAVRDRHARAPHPPQVGPLSGQACNQHRLAGQGTRPDRLVQAVYAFDGHQLPAERLEPEGSLPASSMPSSPKTMRLRGRRGVPPKSSSGLRNGSVSEARMACKQYSSTLVEVYGLVIWSHYSRAAIALTS